MPTFHVTSPEGKTYEVNAPDGATEDQAIAYVQQQHAAHPSQPDSLPDATVTPSFGEKVGAAASDLGRAAAMTGRAVTHGVLGIPELLHDGLIRAPYNAAAEAMGSDSRIAPGGQQIDHMLNSAGVPDPHPQNATERVIQNIDRGIGGLVSGVGIGSGLQSLASPVARGVGAALTSNLGSQTAATIAGAGSSDVAREAGVGPTGQVIAGLAGGIAPAGVGSARIGLGNLAGSALPKPSPEVAQLAKSALEMGIPLKASQVSPSKVGKLVDSVTGQVPFSGSQKFSDSQTKAFGRQIAKTIGENADNVTSEVFARAKARIGASYDDLASRINTEITPSVQKKLDGVLGDAEQFGTSDSVNAIQSALNRVKEQAVAGQLPGKAYKSLDSQLGNVVKNGGEKGNYAKQLQQVLRDAFTNSASPADKAQMALANKQYGNLKTIQPLVANDSVEGNISPAQLLGRVNANNAGKGAMAEGRRGELGDLANIGQKFLKQQVTDSGTAPRLAVMQGLKTLGTGAAGAGAATFLGGLGTLLTGAGIVGGARGAQKALQNPRFVNQLLGVKNENQLNQLLQQYANPAAQGALSGRQ